MSVVITGGGGFLGRRLAAEIARRGHLALPDGTEVVRPGIVLADVPGALGAIDIPGTSPRPLDVRDRTAVAAALVGAQAVFHLAAVVSGQAEADLALGLAVNLDGTRHVLDALAATGRRVPVIATSSVAVFGPAAREPLTEATQTRPVSSYGTAKAMGELLMSDYRRRGLAEARCLRLPTIVVRPGAANAAASSFASAIVREPLAGRPAMCPVDPGLPMWLASPEGAVGAMLHALSVPETDWPDVAALNLPGTTATVAEILDALAATGGGAARDLVHLDPDPHVEAIVASWPARFDTALAQSLGFAPEVRVAEIVARYARSIR